MALKNVSIIGRRVCVCVENGHDYVEKYMQVIKGSCKNLFSYFTFS